MDAKLKLQCSICYKEFLRYRSNYRGVSYCSKECSNKSQLGRKHYWARPIKKLLVLPCTFCSQPIQKWNCLVNTTNFCSRNCQARWLEISQIGDKSPNWKGGKYSTIAKTLCNSRYRRIRQLVISLDGCKCQLCASDIKLEVHHIIEKGKNPALILDITNLITLCKKCHCSIRGKENNYIGIFDEIVAKRANSENAKAKAMPTPNQAESMTLACVETNGPSSKEMI